MSNSVVVPPVAEKRRKRAFRGAIAGHLIEWYDYGIYGFLAVFVGQAFFASEDRAVNLLSGFAVFALSFFIRPLGGLFFGPMADRIGRKQTLLIVMILMAGSTFAIGLLPTYAAIGVVAPLLLVLARCVQGFSAGGEIGTITSFIAEYSGPKRRGYATSWLMVTAVLGLMLGSLVANGLILALGTEAMQDWGWRLPFLIAGPLGAIAIYIRLKLEDSPEFQALAKAGERTSTPLRDSLAWGRPIGLVFGIITVHASMFYLVLTFASTFLTETLGFGTSVRFWFILTASLLVAAVMPLGGMITDRYGRRTFLLIVGIASTGSMVWFFLAAPGATPLAFAFPLYAVALCLGLYASSTYATMTELIPTSIRSTGISIAYNLPVAIFGGSAPFIAAWFISSTGSITSPWYFFAATGLISIISLVMLRDDDFARAAAQIPAAEGSEEQTAAGVDA